MSLINLAGKTALVTGVADNVGFGWYIAKALASHGAEIIISCHPRVESILERFLSKDKYKESRLLDNNQELKPRLVIPCDVGDDQSIADMVLKLSAENIHINTFIHSLAFSPEISRLHLDVSRHGYLTAMSISSYSLVALSRALLPFMVRESSIVALSYLASERAVPFYGGAMASAKAALECDARMLAWQLGEYGHRINIISAGPYASRAARSIGDVEAMIEKTQEKSPLRRAITPRDVAHTALFLASDLSSAITGEIIHVDAGFHAMALV
jgi:enoyl-[acyl-carrier protein] reductase I